MTRRLVRQLLVAALAAASIFACWAWLRPYHLGADPDAACFVKGALVRRDRSNYWLDLHLRTRQGSSFDLSSPVRLLTGSGREIEPATAEFSPVSGEPASDIWLKFWLESADLEQRLELRTQKGTLLVKSTGGIPGIQSGKSRHFTSSRW